MERVSDELLCQIFNYLDPWTLLKTVQPVCRRFRRVALETKLWYNFVSPTRNHQSLKSPVYDHWAEVDWQNEWKWRNTPLRVRHVDDAVTVLTFALHESDVVGLIDDGTLRRWRESNDGWQEVSRTESTAGRETFRFKEIYGSGGRGSGATTQLGYNNAISVFENSINYGLGQALQQLDAESGITAELYKFQQSGSLITAIHQFDRSTLLFGSFPSGLHVMDLRQRYAVYEGELPKAPSAGQATPLCVRHSQINDNTFIVCGRFPSVLMYDIRGGLRPSFSIYSGANSLSSMIAGSGDVVVAGGSYRGRGTLECFNIRSQKLESKNRWTASNATILALATRNSGVFAAGGAGNLRIMDGIQGCVRTLELDRLITKMEVDPSTMGDCRNSVERVFVGCATDGISYIEFGASEDLSVSEEVPMGNYRSSAFPRISLADPDMRYFGRFMR